MVIAIISLLVSILLPSLKRAKDLARNVACLSNLRAQGQGYLMYQADYGDMLWQYWDDSGWRAIHDLTTHAVSAWSSPNSAEGSLGYYSPSSDRTHGVVARFLRVFCPGPVLGTGGRTQLANIPNPPDTNYVGSFKVFYCPSEEHSWTDEYRFKTNSHWSYVFHRWHDWPEGNQASNPRDAFWWERWKKHWATDFNVPLFCDKAYYDAGNSAFDYTRTTHNNGETPFVNVLWSDGHADTQHLGDPSFSQYGNLDPELIP